MLRLIKGRGSKLGLYLGWQGMTFVETKATKIDNFAYLPYSKEEGADNITAVLANPLKISALVQQGLRQLKKEGTKIESVLALTQKDILIRYLSMAYVPVSEIEKALSFEIRKYIPFRMEELQYTSQKFRQPKEKKIDILWVGIKKDTYSQYLSIFQQTDIRLKSLEPAAISMIRLLMNKINIKKESIAFADISNLDSNITIINKGIPIFTREVRFSVPLKSKTQEQELIKLGNEFRMAFDFYRRQYTLEGINKIILVSDVDIADFFKEFGKEMDIPLDSYRPGELIDSNIADLKVETLRCAGASLKDTIKTPFKINLYKKPREKRLFYLPSTEEFVPVSKVAVTTTVIVCVSIIVCLLIFSYTKISKLKRDLSVLINNRPKTTEKYNALSLDKLKKEKDNLQNNINTLQALVDEKGLLCSEKLAIIAEAMPEGIWLSKFSYLKKDSVTYQITMEGFAYRADKTEEARIVDLFISKLKDNPKFKEGFKRVQLDYKSRAKVSGYEVERFSISCLSL